MQILYVAVWFVKNTSNFLDEIVALIIGSLELLSRLWTIKQDFKITSWPSGSFLPVMGTVAFRLYTLKLSKEMKLLWVPGLDMRGREKEKINFLRKESSSSRKSLVGSGGRCALGRRRIFQEM